MALPEGVVAVMAKPPRTGAVKTRLAPRLGAQGAALLAQAFLADTWAALQALGWARVVLAGTEPDVTAYGLGAVELWGQGEGDLGARMAHVAARALRVAPWVMLVGSDSPGMPVAHLEAARAALARCDVVVGPSEDGGFYLLGLRCLETGLLDGLPWSAPTTRQATEARLRSRGLSVALAPPWFDVDRPEDVTRLARLLHPDARRAPATAAALATLGLGGAA